MKESHRSLSHGVLVLSTVVLLFLIIRKAARQTPLQAVTNLPDSLVLAVLPSAVYTADLSSPGKFLIHCLTLKQSKLQTLATLQGNVTPIYSGNNMLYALHFPATTPTCPSAKIIAISLQNGKIELLLSNFNPIISLSHEQLYPVAATDHAIYWLTSQAPAAKHRFALMRMNLPSRKVDELVQNIPNARQIFCLSPYICILQEWPTHQTRTVIQRTASRIPIFRNTLCLFDHKGKAIGQIDNYNSQYPPVVYQGNFYWVQNIFALWNNSTFPDHYRIVYTNLSGKPIHVLEELPAVGNAPLQLYVYGSDLYMAQSNTLGATRIWRYMPQPASFELLFQINTHTTSQLLFQGPNCYFVQCTNHTNWFNWSHSALYGQPKFTLYRFPLNRENGHS
ncbi:MAG TPA: hypothetical protein VKV18_15305 [Chthonomonas sp.]|uniref:hypothetical protein n=1 Tax=Chthonomonas sp. TaxID=2282153 RepID=UPI002B4B7532|nr:hypothetical protein [Chthonomonas sp.]HLI50037.1 hypothetical protein [Chthonomonas sp.]